MSLVEDVMLSLATTGEAGTIAHWLGSAVLIEFALSGRVQVDENRSGSDGPEVFAVEGFRPSHPLLRSAYERIARRPADIPALLREFGAELSQPAIDRLLERCLIRPGRQEGGLLEEARAVLNGGDPPDPRTATVIAVLIALRAGRRGATAGPSPSRRPSRAGGPPQNCLPTSCGPRGRPIARG
jgi:hypothetical protein